MADPALVGMVTGVIGAVTGIAGLVVSVKNYSHIASMKSLDLRIRLQESLNDLDLVRKGIGEFVDFVNTSRQRVMAARGHWNGGAGEIWKKQFADDKAALQRLLAKAPTNVGGYP